MPNALRVLINFARAVKGNAMTLSLQVGELKGLRTVLGKVHLLERHQNDPVLRPIVIAQLEGSFGEFGVSANPVQKFVNRDHLDSG
jgi:hypothetical protein